MSGPRVLREPDAEAAARRGAEEVAAAIGDALGARGAAHVALSGGRTPARMHELLGPLVTSWRGVHVWFADERCVPPDDPESNARMVRETLDAPGAVVHRIEGELGAEEAAAAYERELGDVVLDVAVLGLGEDGHTASLFPRHPALENSDPPARRDVPVHDAPKPPPDRVSLSLPTLNGARQRLLLVTGAGKAGPLAGALGEPTPDVPASLLRREGLTVVADADAAAGLRDG